MNPEDKLNLPPIASNPTPEHGQILFALGQITGEMKGMKIEMEGLKDAKIIQNGRVGKLEERMNKTESWQAGNDGEEKGISKTWAIILALAGLLVGGLSVWIAILALHIHLGN